MFERYTEKARRTIFHARYAATEAGCPMIETEHILLGIIEEIPAVMSELAGSTESLQELHRCARQQSAAPQNVPLTRDLPLSTESKRVLAYAAEEADRLHHRQIDTEHLLVGLLQEPTTRAARLLSERAVDLARARRYLPNSGSASLASGAPSTVAARGNYGVLNINVGPRECLVQFVCNGQRLLVLPLQKAGVLPRSGDLVVLEALQAGKFRVLEVAYYYEPEPGTTSAFTPPRWLAGIVVSLTPEM